MSGIFNRDCEIRVSDKILMRIRIPIRIQFRMTKNRKYLKAGKNLYFFDQKLQFTYP
jgi:hypothetical protein